MKVAAQATMPVFFYFPGLISVLRQEHSQFPFENHHSQLCEGVMGTKNSAGMPECGYGLEAPGQLVLELQERQRDAQPLSHRRWIGHLA